MPAQKEAIEAAEAALAQERCHHWNHQIQLAVELDMKDWYVLFDTGFLFSLHCKQSAYIT